MVGAPHVQLLGEAVLRSSRVAVSPTPFQVRLSYSGLFIETRNTHQRNRICISRSLRHSASCTVSIFLRDKYARKKNRTHPSGAGKCIMRELNFSQVNRGIPLTWREGESEVMRTDGEGGGLSWEVGGVARIPLTVIFPDISLRSSVSLCHPGSNFCAQ